LTTEKKEVSKRAVEVAAHYECMVMGLIAMCLPTQTTDATMDPWIII
jgi:hypothetical protein